MSSSYVKDLKADIKGAKKYKLYADGVEQGGSFALQPGYHTLSLKFFHKRGIADPHYDVVLRPVHGRQAVYFRHGRAGHP